MRIRSTLFCRFAYPERRKHTILREFSLTIRQGQKCALVGYSGCGKSTIIELLLRFYDPDSGTVLLDGTDIRCFSLNSLRSVMAIVSQEPTLFQGSIFGKPLIFQMWQFLQLSGLPSQRWNLACLAKQRWV